MASLRIIDENNHLLSTGKKMRSAKAWHEKILSINFKENISFRFSKSDIKLSSGYPVVTLSNYLSLFPLLTLFCLTYILNTNLPI